MAGAGKKTFTAGEVLTASDVNTYLMEQSVMYFGGTAARASAIPTPSTGMTTYIGTTGTATIPQIETYTGSAWQTPYGLTQIVNASASAAATITLDNVFNTTYENYKIEFNLTGSTPALVRIRLRDGSGDSTGTNYRFSSQQIVGGSWANLDNSTTENAFTVGFNGGIRSSGTINLYCPNVAVLTSYNAASSYEQYGTYGGGTLNVSTQWTGLKIFATSGTITGNVRVYGMRNS